MRTVACDPAFILLLVLILNCQPTLAQEFSEVNQADLTVEHLNDLSRNILAKEVELQKLNAHFRKESIRQPRLRPWRQFAYSETNASCTESGLIGRMVLSYPYMSKPETIYKRSTVTTSKAGKVVKSIKWKATLAPVRRPPSRLIEQAATTQMIGQIVGAAGDVFELSSNVVATIKARKHGFDGKTYSKKVKATAKELDELLVEREKFLQSQSNFNENDLQIARAESAVLHDVRDLSLQQYTQYHSGARSLHFFQNAAYVLNISKNAAGAAGNIVNLESAHLRQPKLGGAASVLSAVAGAIIVVTPVLGRVSGNLAGMIDRRIVSKNFVDVQARESAEFVAHRNRLSELLSQSERTSSIYDVSQRNKLYEKEEGLLLAQKGNLEREHKLAKSTTIENVVFGTLVGSSRITQGVLGMLAAWRYPDKPWMAARLTAAGSTAYGGGTAFNILETARVRAASEFSSRTLRKEHLLPGQIVQDRINTLDEMERSLGTLTTASSHGSQASVATPTE